MIKIIVDPSDVLITKHIIEVDPEIGHIIEKSSCDIYDGETEIDPTFESITLDTSNKKLKSDICVNAIKVEYVTNSSGGKTVYIGGNIDNG